MFLSCLLGHEKRLLERCVLFLVHGLCEVEVCRCLCFGVSLYWKMAFCAVPCRVIRTAYLFVVSLCFDRARWAKGLVDAVFFCSHHEENEARRLSSWMVPEYYWL